jgi:hypothetical protein
MTPKETKILSGMDEAQIIFDKVPNTSPVIVYAQN